jgi:hypothetical protein
MEPLKPSRHRFSTAVALKQNTKTQRKDEIRGNQTFFNNLLGLGTGTRHPKSGMRPVTPLRLLFAGKRAKLKHDYG